MPEGLIRLFFAESLEKSGIEADFETINEAGPKLDGALKEADFVIGDYTFKIPITSEMVAKMERVKLIAQPSTGYDHIDLVACRKNGIPVSNIGGANAISVAEHTLAAALVLLKRMGYAHRRMVEGAWVQEELLNVAAEVHGKTWGVIGLGRIGKEVAWRARAMGANVVYTDLARLPDADELKLGVSHLPLQRLLSESDVVSIHVPLTPATRQMLGEKEFRLMKSYAVFINVSRGELTDEGALAKAVAQGWIGGAAVDVFTSEPLDAGNPLLVAAKEGANLVLTPHIAGATNDARLRIIQTTVENVLRVALGEPPLNVVNP
ncbi:MAG: 2-hydroxyacid dehydrogenase [Nitrososphaerota archaeon]|nr:2-hydroxyacid dehydrogenase [Nitrososphaerota archaeon]MDG6990466.1 2-hydroxyacid dehydrogenase [Nitrososphaerota archaeon]